ncbi:hypothetical protein [Bartonella sp. CR84HXZ]|uniref:hypothetical protein n=1 Tax=Bartonella sp. CR84HXZ TaxID=1460997 RepID=UPI0035D126A9
MKALNSNQLFAFSADKHLDIAKTPGILGYPQSGINSCMSFWVFKSLFDRCVDDQKHKLINKVVSEDWQEN